MLNEELHKERAKMHVCHQIKKESMQCSVYTIDD